MSGYSIKEQASEQNFENGTKIDLLESEKLVLPHNPFAFSMFWYLFQPTQLVALMG